MGKEQGDFVKPENQAVMRREADGAEMLVSTPAQRVQAVAAGYREHRKVSETASTTTTGAQNAAADAGAREGSETQASSTVRKQGARSGAASSDESERA